MPTMFDFLNHIGIEAEALTLIGGFALLAGVLLYLPFHIWIKRRKKQESSSPKGGLAIRITNLGLIVYGSMIIVLLAVYAQGRFHPETPLGELMNNPLGRMLGAVCVAVVTGIIEAFLKQRGYRLFERVTKED